MLRFLANGKALNDLGGGGIDDVDSIAETVWYVETRRESPHSRTQFVWPSLGVDVSGVKHWRHARQGVIGEPRRYRWRCLVRWCLTVTRHDTCGAHEHE